MADQTLTSVPLGLFVNVVGLGVLGGYGLRIIEHLVWSIRAPKEQNPHGNVLFALMLLPQSLVFGYALGYLLLAVAAPVIQSSAALAVCSFCLPALMSFLACDLRELLRRITRM
jgi:hypothetical protein